MGKALRGETRGRGLGEETELRFIRCLMHGLSPLLALALPPFGFSPPRSRYPVRSVFFRLPGLRVNDGLIGGSVIRLPCPQHCYDLSCLYTSQIRVLVAPCPSVYMLSFKCHIP